MREHELCRHNGVGRTLGYAAWVSWCNGYLLLGAVGIGESVMDNIALGFGVLLSIFCVAWVAIFGITLIQDWLNR